MITSNVFKKIIKWIFGEQGIKICTLFMLILPLIIISAVKISLKINIFDNPDFWYAYMAYFGTVVLAGVSCWQNKNANETNNKLIKQQLQQQIGYFMLERTADDKDFLPISIGNIRDSQGVMENDKEKFIRFMLCNIGDDIILLNSILCNINGNEYNLPCEIGIIFKGNKFGVLINNENNIDCNNLTINIIAKMSNTASCSYRQSIYIECHRESNRYIVDCYKTNIMYSEEKHNG